MADAPIEFTNVTSLRPEALGEPGGRTLRILVDSGSSSAVMWLEKEQLFQLALATNQLLFTLPEVQSGEDSLPAEREAPPLTRLEFKVGKLVLGHDGGSGKFIIDAHDEESGEDGPASIRVWGDRLQVKDFADEAFRVCAAGRPICPLCGSPIDPNGHLCPRSNGHNLHDLGDFKDQ